MRKAFGLALALVAAGCGAADAQMVRSPSPAAAPMETATIEAPPAVEPMATQSFASDDVAYGFVDADRSAKLAAAFPAIERMVADVVRTSGIPGMTVGVVVDDRLEYAKGFGVADLSTRATPDADTVYRIASISKSFTALAVLSLRDEGKLSLDDPITRWIPEAGALVYPTRDTPPITLRQLLNHTSGLPRGVAFEPGGPSVEQLAAALRGLRLENAPGTHFSYSNLGFSLLGLVAAKVTHQPLHQAITERIAAPLGMTSTVWDPEEAPKGKLATPYTRDAGGAVRPTEARSLGAAEGSGGVFSSVRDLARYVAFQLAAYPPRNAHDDGPVRRSSVREAHFSALDSGMSVQMIDSAKKGERLVDVVSQRYGFGWSVERNCDFDHLVWHNGSIEGYVSKVEFLPEYGVGVIALANISGSRAYQADGVADQMLRILKTSGGLVRRSPKLATAFEPTMKQFLAVYNAWDEGDYHAMLRQGRNEAPDEKRELAGYKALHGACTGYSVLEAFSPWSARLEMKCERASLEMRVGLAPSDGKIDGFIGTSRDVAPPAPLEKMAERIASLVGKWDDGAYRRHLRRVKPRDETAKFFASLRAMHRTCTVKSSLREGFDWKMRLSCERGGDLSLELALDPKDANVVAGYALTSVPEATCAGH